MLLLACWQEGVFCVIYLDDLITVSSDIDAAHRDFAIVRELLHELGLPESTQKIQAPSTCVTWLGVCIDAQKCTLSLPSEKIADVTSLVEKTQL